MGKPEPWKAWAATRQALAAATAEIDGVLPGSVVVRHMRCGKSGCACRPTRLPDANPPAKASPSPSRRSHPSRPPAGSPASLGRHFRRAAPTSLGAQPSIIAIGTDVPDWAIVVVFIVAAVVTNIVWPGRRSDDV